MFVRFRRTRHRLQVSLIETRRVAGRVHHEHVASLGTIEVPLSVSARIAFWGALHERLRRLGNRIDAETHGKILGAVHARIPMVTAAEQVALQTENAERDARFWSQISDMHAERIKGHEQLAGKAADAIAGGRIVVTDATARAEAARDRVERLRRGEALSGGLGKPVTGADVVALLSTMGWTAAEIRHAEQLAELDEGLFEEYLIEFAKRREASERRASYSAQRAILRRHRTSDGREAEQGS
jgi:hypothetical protein